MMVKLTPAAAAPYSSTHVANEDCDEVPAVFGLRMNQFHEAVFTLPFPLNFQTVLCYIHQSSLLKESVFTPGSRWTR